MLLRSILTRSGNIYRQQKLPIGRRMFSKEWITQIDNSASVKFAMTQLFELHQTLNIPWWCEIALVTIALRSVVTFSLTANQKKIFQRYDALKPEIEAIASSLKNKINEQAYLTGKTKKDAGVIYRKMLTKEINRLIKRDNCHPFKIAILPLFQIPLWFVLSHSYKNLARLSPDPNAPFAQMAYIQLQNEGFLWFKNLTLPDPTGILPIATALINLANIQVYVNERKRNGVQSTFTMKLVTNGGRLISFAMIPIGIGLPADMTFYWFISASCGLAQNLAFQNPKVMSILGLKRPKPRVEIVENKTKTK